MEGGGDNGRGDAPIGAILQRARRERGLSLGEAEDATKIRKRYLDGLEREDFSVLPDPVYVHGFLKTYANFLGLDGDGLAREFRDRRSPRRERQPNHERYWRSDFETPLLNPAGLAGAERRRVSGATIVTVALAVLVLAAVIGLLYLIGSRSANTPSIPEDPPSQADAPQQPADPGGQPEQEQEGASRRGEAREREAREPAPPAREPPPEEAAQTVSVTVSVPEVPVGLTVREDGGVADDVLAQPGYSQTFEGNESVVVEAANAGAVTVEVDGVDQGFLGYFGQPITQTFTPQPGG